MALNANVRSPFEGKARLGVDTLLAAPFAVIGRAAIRWIDKLARLSGFGSLEKLFHVKSHVFSRGGEPV